jgi:hypothetical protein
VNVAAASQGSTHKVLWTIFIIAAFVCAVAAFLRPQVFFVAYLEAYLFVLSMALGSMLILLIHQLVGGRWGFQIQGLLTAALATLPWLLFFHIPLLFGVDALYIWSRPGVQEAIPILARKDWYLNETFFHIRTALFWALWLWIGFLLRRQVNKQIREGRKETNRRLGSWALIVSVLTMSFASVDWIMSLEPHFYSSIYGLIILTGFMISAFAWVILVDIAFPGFFQGKARADIQQTPSPDLGNLLLMSVMLWAYGSFSQLILVWSGQLPDEILFYHKRFHPPWQALGWSLVLLGFILPFLLLLWRKNKKNSRTLAFIAIVALFGHWLDLVWNVQPFFDQPLAAWLSFSFLTSFTLGGIWLLIFKHSLGKVLRG